MITYPRLLRRVQAVLIDSLIVPLALFGTLTLIGYFDVENIYIKEAGLILPIFILEPLLVTLTGGTIGHHIIGIRVQSANSEKHINIVQACARFLLKALLGWLSLIFILTTKKHQAIHDLIPRSVVVNKSSDNLPASEALAEREVQEQGYTYPAGALRVFMIIVYSLLAYIAYTLLIILFASHQCIELNRCLTLDTVFIFVLNIIWVIAIGFIIVYGWQGKLFGCRRKPVE